MVRVGCRGLPFGDKFHDSFLYPYHLFLSVVGVWLQEAVIMGTATTLLKCTARVKTR